MAETKIYSELDEIEETFLRPSKWLGRELRQQARGATAAATEEATKITLYAHVETPEQPSSVLHVANWKVSDLYAYSEAPRVELLNVFSELLQRVEEVAKSSDDLDFELKTVDLWENFKRLNAYLGISASHDELIATFGTLVAGPNSVLNPSKLACLRKTFIRLRDSINITDDLLDEIDDDLENAGFDLQAPMTFATASG